MAYTDLHVVIIRSVHMFGLDISGQKVQFDEYCSKMYIWKCLWPCKDKKIQFILQSPIISDFLVSVTCTARTVRAVACVRYAPCSLAASGHVTAEAFPPVSGRHLLLSRRTRCSLSACASSSWKAAAIWNSTKIQLLACLWMYSYILFLC